VSTESTTRASTRGGLYAATGIALFTIGGMTLEDAHGSDGLTLIGFVCLACGLLGIISGGVAMGTRSRQH
jgi:hypothetical protein